MSPELLRARKKKAHAVSEKSAGFVNPPTEPLPRSDLPETAAARGKAEKKAGKALVKLTKKEKDRVSCMSACPSLLSYGTLYRQSETFLATKVEDAYRALQRDFL